MTNHTTPNNITLFVYYTWFLTHPCIYPILCAMNELSDNNKGAGYYNFIPQFLLPTTQRPHSHITAWPGIIPESLIENNGKNNSHNQDKKTNNEETTENNEKETTETNNDKTHDKEHDKEHDSKTDVGNVKYIQLEGGFYGITTNDKQKYLPTNIQTELSEIKNINDKNGVHIEFDFVITDEASIYMWGQTIKVLTWKVL